MPEYLSKKIRIMNFISIIAVVFIHAYNYTDTALSADTMIAEGNNIGAMIEYTISNGLARFAVPIFFMTSGFLFYRTFEMSFKGYLAKVKKRAITILIPYVLWILFSIIFLTILQRCGLTQSPTVKYFNPNNSIVNWLLYPPAFQLWYLKAIIILTIISPLGYILLKKCGFMTLLLLFICWIEGISVLVDIEAYLFFFAGGYIAIHNRLDYVTRKAPKWAMMLSTCIWVLLCVGKSMISANGNPEDWFLHQQLYLLYRVAELFGIISVWTLFDYLYKEEKEHKILEFFAAHSFLIYLMHEPLQHVLYDVLTYQSSSTAVHLGVYFGLAIILIILIAVFGTLLRKYLKVVHQVLTGNR